MKRIYVVIVLLAAFVGVGRAFGMEQNAEQIGVPVLHEYTQITFNNHPLDTVIRLNGNQVEIAPNKKNVTVNGVKSVAIKTLKGKLLMLWAIHELQPITAITVENTQQEKEYSITTEPGSVRTVVIDDEIVN